MCLHRALSGTCRIYVDSLRLSSAALPYYDLEAVLRGGQGLPCESYGPRAPPNETGCKVARLHNTCIHSVASHSWCQITPFTQSCMSSGILGPQIHIWAPRWPHQTAAARNAPDYATSAVFAFSVLSQGDYAWLIFRRLNELWKVF